MIALDCDGERACNMLELWALENIDAQYRMGAFSAPVHAMMNKELFEIGDALKAIFAANFQVKNTYAQPWALSQRALPALAFGSLDAIPNRRPFVRCRSCRSCTLTWSRCRAPSTSVVPPLSRAWSSTPILLSRLASSCRSSVGLPPACPALGVAGRGWAAVLPRRSFLDPGRPVGDSRSVSCPLPPQSLPQTSC